MWRVIVPMKPWDNGKARLDVAPALRARYAEAMAVDTLMAINGCPVVDCVVALTTSEPAPASPVSDLSDQVLVQPATMDLNEALTWAYDQQSSAPSGTAVVVADLPALRSDELTAALTAATGHRLSMVTDRGGSGTTALAVTGGSTLAARFGPESAARHRESGAVCLDRLLDADALAGLRCDVDTLADLRVATDLGLGKNTADAGLGSPP